MARGQSRWAWVCVALAALAVCFLAGRHMGQRRQATALLPPPPDEDGISLARRLAPRLGLRVVPTSQDGRPKHNAYLTATGLRWKELNVLPRSAEHLGRWRGTLYCERSNYPNARPEEVDPGSDCWLRAGPFIFFGDPELLARLREALLKPEPD
jgi:hypothetical protein